MTTTRTRNFAGRGFEVLYVATSSAIPKHSHPCYAVSYLLRGPAILFIEGLGSYYQSKPGSIAILNPSEVHEHPESPSQREYLAANIDVQFFRELAAEVAHWSRSLPSFSVPTLEYDPQIKRIMETLLSELNKPRISQGVIITGLITELGLYLLRKFGTTHRTDTLDSVQPFAACGVRKALKFLSDNCADEFSLNRVAAHSGLSKYYLEHIFKQATGLSPHQYVLALRLARAKHLLAASDKNIAAVAAELGFTDQSHFTNVFKRFTGVTPMKFRVGNTPSHLLTKKSNFLQDSEAGFD